MPDFHRPTPLRPREVQLVDGRVEPDRAAARLEAGHQLRVRDHYGTGAEILAALGERNPRADRDAPRAERKATDRARRQTARNLLAPIRGHRLALGGARPIGFLPELYPDRPDFDLPLVDVQELRGAWVRYERGVKLAVLGHALHPYYGVYLPKRTTHLELFAQWLSANKGGWTHAVDVGTGSGVLALMLARAGVPRITATDTSPNAVESVRREVERVDYPAPVRPRQGDLLEPVRGEVDLVVFNPPWTMGEPENLLDGALVYRPGLFGRFFDQCDEKLSADGRIVLVFSNILRLAQPDLAHPIDTELADGRFTLVEKLTRRVKSPTGRKTKEKVEVWVLARA